MKLKLMTRLLLLAGFLSGFTPVAQAFYNPSTGRWLSRDPLGDEAFFQSHTENASREELKKWRLASLEPCYAFIHNAPLNYVDVFGLRGWAGAGQIYVWEYTCKKCPELLKNYKYIDEDSPGLKPLHLGHHDADALYIPVGIALKIGDPASVYITCDCCTRCVNIKIALPPVNTWSLPATSPPPGVNWPGNVAPYIVPGAMECAEIEKFRFY